MKLISVSKVAVFFLVIATYASLSSSSFISDAAFQSHTSASGRKLLQDLKPCSVDFEHKDYSVITKRCKGPEYPQKECCSAFKEFACPYADKLNDLSTDCADAMFYYINLHGNYPIGLFADKCTESDKGLACP